MKLLIKIFIFSIVWMAVFHAEAQEEDKKKKKVKKEKIHIKNADEFEGGIFNGKKINKFKGNVVFKQKDTYLYCDSAYQYHKSNTLECFSNVRIVQGDSLTLTGNRLTYEGDTKLATMKGNVYLRDKTMTLTTEYLQYNLRNKEAHYINGGTINDGATTLTSDLGFYNTSNKIFRFKKNVRVVNPSKNFTLTSDTLHYNTATDIATFKGPTHIESADGVVDTDHGYYNVATGKTTLVSQGSVIQSGTYKLTGDFVDYDEKNEVGIAKKNVKLYSAEDNVIIEGDEGYHWGNKGLSKIFGNAVMKAVMGDDTLYLRADTLISIDPKDASQKKLLAYPKVKIYKSDLQGICDSLAYSVSDSIIFFYRDPVLWSGSSQISADSINIELIQNKIHKMNLRLNSFIVSQDTLLNFNQVKGRNMTSFFKNEEICRINVDGNGESIYFALDEDSTITVTGMNKVACSNMIIKFDSSEVSGITFIKKPDGKFVPPHEIEEPDTKLKGFAWREEEKPEYSDIVVIRNSIDSNKNK